MTSEERLRELEDKYEGYTVYDNHGEKIGKVDDLFVDDSDNEEYIGVKMGFLGRKSTLIPTEIVRVNEADRRIEVSESKDHVKNAPSFDDDEEVTPDYETQIRTHFGLGTSESSGQGGTYGAYSGDSPSAESAGREDQGYPSGGGEGSPEGETEGGEDRGDRPEEASNASTTSSSGASASGTVASADFAREGSSERGADAGEVGSPPARETTETETYEEGGRTKIRRRIVREEIIEEDG